MINLFLKFDNESAWREYATTAGILTQAEEPVLDNDGNETGKTQTVDQWQYFSLNHAISDIGILYNKDGQYDPETGEEIKAPTAKEGWHVNWKASQFPDGITVFETMPVEVARVWAGDPVELADRVSVRTKSAGNYGLPDDVTPAVAAASTSKKKRAHNPDGTFKANNPDTEVNEAWEN